MAACIPDWPEPAPPSPPVQTPGCVDFSGYPDDTKFGNPFNLNNYDFSGLGGEPFINISGNVVGLQFTNAGLEIDLPMPTSSVMLDVASFTQTPLALSALDANSTVVANSNVPGNSTAQNFTMSGTDIVKIVITGGGDEGFLTKICS